MPHQMIGVMHKITYEINGNRIIISCFDMLLNEKQQKKRELVKSEQFYSTNECDALVGFEVINVNLQRLCTRSLSCSLHCISNATN